MIIRIGSLKIEIRREMFKMAIYFGIEVALLFLLRPFLGIGNAMVFANSFMLIPLSLSNDYTTKFKYNTVVFSIVYTSFGIASWLANFNIISKGIVLFFVVLFLAYSFNRGRKKTLYIVFSINFIFIVHYPVHGIDLLIRLIILESFVIAMMIAQWIVNRQRYRKTVKESVRLVSDEIEEYADISVEGISDEDNERIKKETEKKITESSSLFFTKFDQIREWDRGSQYLRLLSVLKRLCHMIYRYNKTKQGLHEKTYLKIKHIIKTVDNFNFERESFDSLLEEFGRMRLASEDEAQTLEMDTELEIFREEKPDKTVGKNIKEHRFNKYQFLFSLKTAIMASVGVMIIEALGLPYAYWYFVNVCVLSQPFSELGKKSSTERIINTVMATGMTFTAFYVTNYTWVHIVVLVILVIIGDTVFKFNFFTMYSAFMALLLGNFMGQGSIGELSIFRLLYVAGTSALVMVVDYFVSTGKMRTVFDNMLKESRDLNRELLKDLLSEEFSRSRLKQLFDAKIEVNYSIRDMRAYYTEENLDEYMLNEQSLLRMYNAVFDYVVRDKNQAMKIVRLFNTCLAKNDFDNLYGKVPGNQIYAVLVLYDMYETIIRSEELLGEIRHNLKRSEDSKAFSITWIK